LKRINFKSEKGFTVYEVIISLFIVSAAILSSALLLGDINDIDVKSKETHYAKQLIDPYLSYYQNLEVKEKDLNIYLSDVNRIDLIKKSRDIDPQNVPLMFKDLKVNCENYPYEILDESGYPEYLVFEITCDINDSNINKGKSFEIKKFINKD
jgi:competence protein ComGC